MQAKLEAIRAFFDNAVARIAFLEELDAGDHRPEAMTLCLTYIDSFAQWLCWPTASSGQNFVEATIQFGCEPVMGLVHPRQAISAYGRMKAHWKILARDIETIYPGPGYELLPMPAFLDILASRLSAAQVVQLKRELWRATVANMAYQYLRNPSIHEFGTGGGIWFSQTTYAGVALPPLGLQELLRCIRGLVAEARRRSEANQQWFGNDEIVKGV